MKFLFALGLAFTLFVSNNVGAQSKGTISRDGGAPEPIGKIVWKFVDVSTEAKALSAVFILPLPNSEVAELVEGESIYWKPQWSKPGKTMIALGGMKNNFSVTVAGEKKYTFQVDLTLQGTLLKEEGCSAAGLKIKSTKKSPTPVFVGIRCESKTDRVILSMSLPQEVQWDRTSIFETAGKGERWKSYELSRANLLGDGSTVAEFFFRLNESEFNYTLVQKVKPGSKTSKDEKPPFLQFRVGAGVAQLAGKTPLLESSGVGPLFVTDAYTEPLFWKIRAAGQFNFAIPLTGQQYYEYAAALGYGHSWGDTKLPSLFMVGGEYLGLGQDQDVDEKTISLKHNQLGVLILGDIALGKDSRFGFKFRYNGLGGDTTHMGLIANYEWRKPDAKSFLGVGAGFQQQSAESKNGTSEFGQMLGFATYRF